MLNQVVLLHQAVHVTPRDVGPDAQLAGLELPLLRHAEGSSSSTIMTNRLVRITTKEMRERKNIFFISVTWIRIRIMGNLLVRIQEAKLKFKIVNCFTLNIKAHPGLSCVPETGCIDPFWNIDTLGELVNILKIVSKFTRLLGK